MNEITEGNFPEVRSRQEMYLQDIIKSLSNESISDNNYPDPLSRQEAYLQIIISKLRANDPNIEINTEDIEKAVNKYLEQNPIQPGATENQAQQIEKNKKDIALLKTETGSLKEDISNQKEILDNVSESIDGDVYNAYIETEPPSSNGKIYLPLSKFIPKDEIVVFYNPSSTESYTTYFCDAEKSPVLETEIEFIDGKASVIYPNYGLTYAYLRITAKDETTHAHLIKKRTGISKSIDDLTQKNIVTLFADNTGETDVVPIIQNLINMVDDVGEIEVYIPKGTYLLNTPLYHHKGNVRIRCADGVTMIVNSSPIYTTFPIAGADIEPFSLGNFEIDGGIWTTTRNYDYSTDARSTGIQVTKLSRVTVKNAEFFELTQSNHLFDISGSCNVVIENNIFHGMFFNSIQKPTDANGNFELLQIDVASGIDVSICVPDGHNESTKNVRICNNTFVPSGKDNCYLYRPIGLHYAGATKENIADWYDNVLIYNNKFVDVLGRAIEISCMTNVDVSENVFKYSDGILLIDDIIKCGDVTWGYTSNWATFGNISDRFRYNCRNIRICNNDLHWNGDETTHRFINAFSNLDTTTMYKTNDGSHIKHMASNVQIIGNSGDLDIVVKNVKNLKITCNDVPNVNKENVIEVTN